jgi:hypothetical protein
LLELRLSARLSLYLSEVVLGVRFRTLASPWKATVEMSTRDGDEGDQNTKVKLSVLMAPGQTTETEWASYSVEFASGSFNYNMDFELYKSVLEKKS